MPAEGGSLACSARWAFHHWELDRYWSLGGLLVDGRVCRVCKLTHRERKVVYRP